MPYNPDEDSGREIRFVKVSANPTEIQRIVDENTADLIGFRNSILAHVKFRFPAKKLRTNSAREYSLRDILKACAVLFRRAKISDVQLYCRTDCNVAKFVIGTRFESELNNGIMRKFDYFRAVFAYPLKRLSES